VVSNIDQMPHALLPPNSTRLEQALADLAPRAVLDDLSESPRGVKWNPPDAYLPWLASEWFLAGFAKYFPTLRDLIDNGLPWLMERGTAAAVKDALSWIGAKVETLEDDDARLSIDPGRVIGHDELSDIVYLVLQSIPAHVDFYRIFHGYDLRPIGLSGPAALDDGLLSDDSGIWVNVDGEDVKLSFGHYLSRWIDLRAGHWIASVRRDVDFARAWYEDRARLSVWQLDSEIVPNRRAVLGNLMSMLVDGIDAHPPALGRRLTIARSALDLDDDIDSFGSLNCGFAGGLEIEWNPFVLSGSALSAHDNQVEQILIDERFSKNASAAPEAMEPQATYPRCNRNDTLGRNSRLSVWPQDTWRSGGWDTRLWRSPGIRIPIRMTTTEEA
jgi:hypothetical protein